MNARPLASHLAALPPWLQEAASWARDRRFLLGGIAWRVAVLLALFVYATSLPGYYAALQAICIGEGCVPGQLSAANADVVDSLGISLPLYAALAVICNLAAAFVWWAVGIVIFMRKRADWMGLLVALTLMLVGASVPTNQNVLAWRWPTLVVNFLGVVALFLVFCLFPNGRFVPSWLRWLPLLYVVLSAVDFFPTLPLGLATWLEPVHVVLLFGCYAVLAWSQIYRYRYVSTATERHQTKWVLVGALATIVGEFIYWVASLVVPGLEPPASLYQLLFSPISAIVLILFIPISFAIAILRFRLYDINVLINRALVYGTLTLALLIVYVVSVLLFHTLLQVVIRQSSPPAVVISTLLIAALFQPLRLRVQSVIDRRFYRRKYDAVRAIEEFSNSLQTEVELQDLSTQLLSVVHETVAPGHASLWLVQVKPPEEDLPGAQELQPKV
jgi:hypothetical protein